MARKNTISDILAKRKCAEWLQKSGFENIESAKNSSCDLIGDKNNTKYLIEVKYSSKESGKFFGTVMLTEMYRAINNKDNYLFLVCRGDDENINNWFFRLFGVDDFLKCCTLTTPIFHYHLYPAQDANLTIPRFEKNTVIASQKLIEEMWRDFKRWKLKIVE